MLQRPSRPRSSFLHVFDGSPTRNWLRLQALGECRDLRSRLGAELLPQQQSVRPRVLEGRRTLTRGIERLHQPERNAPTERIVRGHLLPPPHGATEFTPLLALLRE